MGLFTTLFMILWMSGPIHGAFVSRGGFSVVSLLFGLLGLPGLGTGLAMLAGGLALLRGDTHSTIEIAGDRIRVVEHFGPFFWRRRFRAHPGQIRRLVVFNTNNFPNHRRSPVDEIPAFATMTLLRAECESSSSFTLAAGYPVDLLQAVAESISGHLAHRPPTSFMAAPAIVPVITASDLTHAEEIPVEKPSTSRAVYSEIPGGFGIAVPPAGLLRGGKGTFLFSVIWLSFIAIFGVAFMLSASHAKSAHASNEWVPVLFILLFATIGFAMLYFSIMAGRQRVFIAATADQLVMRRIRPGNRVREWSFRRAEIAAICAGPSGTKVNDRDILELQIYPVEGKKTGLLSSSTDEELEWLACLLRRHFQVPENPSETH